VNRLPKNACIRTTVEQRTREEWTVDQELLSQLIEVNSIVAAGKQLKKHIIIPRPDHIRRQNKARASGVEHVPDGAYKQGIAVLAATKTARAVGR
jgi:hypothetical protein